MRNVNKWCFQKKKSAHEMLFFDLTIFKACRLHSMYGSTLLSVTRLANSAAFPSTARCPGGCSALQVLPFCSQLLSWSGHVGHEDWPMFSLPSWLECLDGSLHGPWTATQHSDPIVPGEAAVTPPQFSQLTSCAYGSKHVREQPLMQRAIWALPTNLRFGAFEVSLHLRVRLYLKHKKQPKETPSIAAATPGNIYKLLLYLL